jgi:hypothetical protein
MGPELLSRSASIPAGVDLSGIWMMRKDGGAPMTKEGERPQTVQMPRRNSTRNTQQKRRKSSDDYSDVWIFIETGKRLRVTQTGDGLFISYDRAVVEEYTFGENRTASVGPIEVQRVSGWIGQELVIESMGKQGYVLTETWALDDDNSVLVRKILLVKGEDQLFSATQVFDRA